MSRSDFVLFFVIPAKAGTQGGCWDAAPLDPRFRGGDDNSRKVQRPRARKRQV